MIDDILDWHTTLLGMMAQSVSVQDPNAVSRSKRL
jgi:hypothetical protein